MITLKPCTKSQEQWDTCPYCAQIGPDEEDIKKYPNVTFVPLSLCMKWYNENEGNGIIHACEPPKENRITIEYEDKTIVIPKSKIGSIKFENASGNHYKKWYPSGLDELFDELLNDPEKKELSQKIAQMECSTFDMEKVIAGLKEECNKKNDVIREYLNVMSDKNNSIDALKKRIHELINGGYKTCRTCKHFSPCHFDSCDLPTFCAQYDKWEPKE